MELFHFLKNIVRNNMWQNFKKGEKVDILAKKNPNFLLKISWKKLWIEKELRNAL